MSKIIAIVNTFSYDGMTKINSFVEYESGVIVKYNENFKTHREFVNTRVCKKCYLIQTKRYAFDIAHFRHENEMLYFENSNIMYGNNVNGFKTLVYTDDIVKYVKKHFINNEITDKFFEVYGTTETTETTEKCYIDTDSVAAENTDTKELSNKIKGYFDECVRHYHGGIVSMFEHNTTETTENNTTGESYCNFAIDHTNSIFVINSNNKHEFASLFLNTLISNKVIISKNHYINVKGDKYSFMLKRVGNEFVHDNIVVFWFSDNGELMYHVKVVEMLYDKFCKCCN